LATLESDPYSEDSVQYWVARFESGETNCEDLADPFRLFLKDYLFASARMLSRYFNVCAITMKEVLARDLGVQKLT
jgi:hypothetical protein